MTRVIERLELMKIPILGMVVNRTGSDAEQSYYGYHNYGYGYGYGYGEEYGHEHDAKAENAAQAASPTIARPFGHDADEREEPPALIVPRRVA